MVLQCINDVSSNPVEERATICQLKDLILTLLDLIFRRTCIYILFYYEHSCEGDVGYPPGMLVVEGKNRNASMYHEIADISYERTSESGACSSMQYLSFGISFHPELDHGKINR
jgi:hypothetical protein